jgi:hypothetical protein
MAKSPRGSNAATATVHDQELGRIGEPEKLRLWGREPTVKMR